MSKRFRIIQTSSTVNNDNLIDCSNESLIVNRNGNICLGNGSKNPTIISTKNYNELLNTPTKLSQFTDDVVSGNYATSSTVLAVDNRLKNIEQYFSTEGDADQKINKWNEIVTFLNATEGDTLDNILTTKADKIMTVPLTFNGSDVDRNVIRVNCTTTGTDASISEYGFTLKFLGSGTGVNNALALYADNQTATTQNLATKWLNDGTMYGRSIVPHNDNTFDLGSSDLRYKNIYGTTINGILNGSIDAPIIGETSEDLDNFFEGGKVKFGTFNQAMGITNTGLQSNDGLIISHGYAIANNKYGYQLALDDNGYNISFRYKNNTWQEWKKLAFMDASGYVNKATSATSATKLTSDAGSSVHPIYFSGGKPVKISNLNDRQIGRILPNDNGSIKNISIIDKSASYLHSANRLQFANPNGIIVEYSTDGGTTWIDYGLTDSEKISLVSGQSILAYAGKKLSPVAVPNDQLRITIDANLCGFYTSADALLINFSVNGSTNCRVNVERAYRGSETEFTTWKTGLEVSGWSGWNSLPLGFSFGGGSTQTTNIGAIRLTFYSDGASESYTSGAHFTVQDLQLLGSTYWHHPSNMAKTGHLYNWDVSQNMIIPASILPKQRHTTDNIGSNIGAPGLQFNTVYSRYIDTDEYYNLRLKSGGVEHINMIDGNVNATANIIPTATETYNLGTSSYYWKNVYAKTFNGNLNGTFNGNDSSYYETVWEYI